MKLSKFITNVSLNDNIKPGQIISLNVHEIDGGYIGIDTNFTDEVANYIINPYLECEIVKIVDPDGNDDAIDPPLAEDTLIGFLRLLVGFDQVIEKHISTDKIDMRQEVSKLCDMTVDDVDILLGLAKEILTDVKEA